MIFNTYSHLADKHAILSPSKYHWINYSDEKMDRMFITAMAAQKGTELHDLAHKLIRLGVKLRGDGSTLSLYVNDAIGYKMHPEQTLYYSDNAFGTCDAIQFRRSKLRIHDLKTGVTQTSEHQLEVYAALFCLEYMVKPHEIETELRIYQSNEARIYDADPDVIVHIMDKIRTFDSLIAARKLEALS